MSNMKLVSPLRLLAVLVAGALLSVFIAGTVAASHDDSVTDVHPVFNFKEDTSFINPDGSQEVRPESDFLRFGNKGEFGNGDDVDFCTDQTLDLWFYVHNGIGPANNNLDGSVPESGATEIDDVFDGPGVAQGTIVRIEHPSEPANQHTVNADISSDTSGTITDSVEVNCSDETKQIALSYSQVAADTTLSTRAPVHTTLGQFRLRGDIASESGAKIGYGGDDQGIVPSCHEYSAVIRGKLQIIVTDKTTVEDPGEDDPEDPDDPPEDPPEEEPPVEGPEDPPEEDEPDDIPPLGPGSAAPLVAAAFSSALAGAGYRLIQIRRRR